MNVQIAEASSSSHSVSKVQEQPTETVGKKRDREPRSEEASSKKSRTSKTSSRQSETVLGSRSGCTSGSGSGGDDGRAQQTYSTSASQNPGLRNGGEESAEKINAAVLMMLSQQAFANTSQNERIASGEQQQQIDRVPQYVGPTVVNPQFVNPSIVNRMTDTIFCVNADGSNVPGQIIHHNGQNFFVQQTSTAQAKHMNNPNPAENEAEDALSSKRKKPAVKSKRGKRSSDLQERQDFSEGSSYESMATEAPESCDNSVGSLSAENSSLSAENSSLSAENNSGYMSSAVSSSGCESGPSKEQRQIFKRERNRLHARKSRERKKQSFAALNGRAAQLTGLLCLLLEAAIKYVPQDICATCIAKCRELEVERWTDLSPEEKLKPLR